MLIHKYGGKHIPKHLWLPLHLFILDIPEQSRREGGSVAPGSAILMAPNKVKFRYYLL